MLADFVIQRSRVYCLIMYYHLSALADNHRGNLLTFPAGLLRCMYVANGIGLFFLSLSSGVTELAAELERMRMVLSRAQDYFKTEMRLF